MTVLSNPKKERRILKQKKQKKKIIKQYYYGTLVMIPSCSKPIQPLQATCAFNLSVPLVKKGNAKLELP